MAIDTNDTATIHIFNKKARGRPKTRQGTTKDHNREAQAKLRAVRREAGYKQSTVWLSPEALEVIGNYQSETGFNKDVAISELVELAGKKVKR